MIIGNLLNKSCMLFCNHMRSICSLPDNYLMHGHWQGGLFVIATSTHVTVGEEASTPVHMHEERCLILHLRALLAIFIA